jgi:alkanesulfonate monooxygenase SsuD/methylene tetrahydromethanopterin reductase-like flavin-dependent oxidoreductase (luciferase family)
MWVSDHLFLNDGSARKNCLEAWTLLSALSQVTTTLRLGTMVTCQSYRNPALLAKIAAGVDHMSGGRLEFGIGAGWKELEYKAYGYEFSEGSRRVDELADTIEICRRMWTEDKATFHGKRHRIDDAQCMPKPVQDPMPMWIAGSKPRIMRLAAKYASGVNVGGFPTPARYAEVMRLLESACDAVKRDPASIVRSQFGLVVVGETEKRVGEIVAEQARATGVSPEEWRARRADAPIGTPEQVAEKLRPYVKLGVSYFIPVFPYGYDRECLRAFARGVVPLLS